MDKLLFPLRDIGRGVLLMGKRSGGVLCLRVDEEYVVLVVMFVAVRFGICLFTTNLSVCSFLLLFLGLSMYKGPVNCNV